jgi:hypothetical protein
VVDLGAVEVDGGAGEKVTQRMNLINLNFISSFLDPCRAAREYLEN